MQTAHDHGTKLEALPQGQPFRFYYRNEEAIGLKLNSNTAPATPRPWCSPPQRQEDWSPAHFFPVSTLGTL